MKLKDWQLAFLISLIVVAAALFVSLRAPVEPLPEPVDAPQDMADPLREEGGDRDEEPGSGDVVDDTPVQPLSEASCTEAGGTWNPCGSACEEGAEVCIEVCVEVCECDTDAMCPSGYSCDGGRCL